MEAAGGGFVAVRTVWASRTNNTTAFSASSNKDVKPLCVSWPQERRRSSRRRHGAAGLLLVEAAASDKVGGAAGGKKSGDGGRGVPTNNYVVPLDKSSPITRPLVEILRDLNKRVPEKIVNSADNSIAWYHTNRMLSFYAPGWCGEVRDVIFSENGYVSVIYRVTVRGSDGEAHREATGTVAMNDGRFEDPVATAEELAFCKACARFGFGLYLYHEDDLL